jgi:hypothetical protein
MTSPKSNLTSIWQFSPSSLLALTSAYAIYEPITYYAIPALSSSSTVHDYYNHRKIPFPVVAAGDYLYSLILFLIAQQVIASTVTIGSPWLLGFLVFVAVQWTGDLAWYGLVTSAPTNVSSYINFFKRYTQQVGAWALVGDSIYGLFWFSLAQLILTNVPIWIQVGTIIAFLFGTLVVSI